MKLISRYSNLSEVGTLISGIKSVVLRYIKLYKYEFLLTSHFYWITLRFTWTKSLYFTLFFSWRLFFFLLPLFVTFEYDREDFRCQLLSVTQSPSLLLPLDLWPWCSEKNCWLKSIKKLNRCERLRVRWKEKSFSFFGGTKFEMWTLGGSSYLR